MRSRVFPLFVFLILLSIAAAPLAAQCGKAQEASQSNPPAPVMSLAELAKLYDYDAKQPLDVQGKLIEEKDGVRIHDITYASPKGGRVTAYLMEPVGKGPFAGIVFGHWGPGDRTEFLAEASLYAKAGAVSVLIDYPWTRPAPWNRNVINLDKPETDHEIYIQAVVDLRRAIDLLLARPDVDPKRIAYIGHSYGAQWGAILSAVDRRMKTSILVAGIPDRNATWVEPEDAGSVAFRKAVPKEQFEKYLAVDKPLSAINYVPHAAPIPLFFQFARYEPNFSKAAMDRYFAAASQPKAIQWYNTGHEVYDPRALVDRASWLKQHIGIREVGPAPAVKSR